MPLDHDGATVSVHVTGVSLGCINDLTKKWEVGFVRKPDHTLNLEITRIRSGKSETVYGPVVIDPKRILIEAFKPVHKDSAIASIPGNDPERFKLLVDIEKDVYRGRKIKLKKPEYFHISEMYVSNARLYSVPDLTSRGVMITRTDTYEKPRMRDQIGTTAGADIQCEAGGKVVVRIDEWEHVLDQENGTRYVVWFDNRCPPAKASESDTRESDSSRELTEITKLTSRGRLKVMPHSDFVLYYDLIDPEGKGKYDLIRVRRPKGEGAVCNYNHLGESDWMFPLPIT